MAFWVYWLAASIGVKAGQTRWTRFAGIRAGVILLILLLLRARAFKGNVVTNNPWLQGIGLAVFAGARGGGDWNVLCLQRHCGGALSGPPFPGSYTEYKRSTKMLMPFII